MVVVAFTSLRHVPLLLPSVYYVFCFWKLGSPLRLEHIDKEVRDLVGVPAMPSSYWNSEYGRQGC